MSGQGGPPVPRDQREGAERMIIPDLVVIDSSTQPAAPCVVCGTAVAAGAGLTARFHGRILRFKCPGCLSRFAVDPDHFLSDGPTSCCDGEHRAEAFDSQPAGEWFM